VVSKEKNPHTKKKRVRYVSVRGVGGESRAETRWLGSPVESHRVFQSCGGGVVADDSGDLGGELVAVDSSDTDLRQWAVTRDHSRES
jgi:hypothetical protein